MRNINNNNDSNSDSEADDESSYGKQPDNPIPSTRTSPLSFPTTSIEWDKIDELRKRLAERHQDFMKQAASPSPTPFPNPVFPDDEPLSHQTNSPMVSHSSSSSLDLIPSPSIPNSSSVFRAVFLFEQTVLERLQEHQGNSSKAITNFKSALERQPGLESVLIHAFRQNPQQILGIIHNAPIVNFDLSSIRLCEVFQLLPALTRSLELFFQDNFNEEMVKFLRPNSRINFGYVRIIEHLFPNSLYPKLIAFLQNPKKFQELVTHRGDIIDVLQQQQSLHFMVILAVATKISTLDRPSERPFPNEKASYCWISRSLKIARRNNQDHTQDTVHDDEHTLIGEAIDKAPPGTHALVFQQACQAHLTHLGTRMMREITGTNDSNEGCGCGENGFSFYFWTLMTTWKMCEERLVDDVATIVMDYAADYGSRSKKEDFFTVSYLFLMEMWKGVHQSFPVMRVSSLITEYVCCEQNSHVFFTTHRQALTRMVEAPENPSENSQPTEPSPPDSPPGL